MKTISASANASSRRPALANRSSCVSPVTGGLLLHKAKTFCLHNQVPCYRLSFWIDYENYSLSIILFAKFKYNYYKADRPCIVAIDEFQQVTKYPEGNIEALLSGRIQKLVNTHFIFAGSERRLMNEMFFSDKRNAIAADRCVEKPTKFAKNP